MEDLEQVTALLDGHAEAAGRVLVLGDSHGATGMVTGAIELAADDGAVSVVSVGDFGFWPGDRGRWFLDEVEDAARGAGVPVLVVPGNHDDYDRSDAAPRHGGWISPRPWIRAVPRGHVWRLAGLTWLGLGGAASIDGPGGVWPQQRGHTREGLPYVTFDHMGTAVRRPAPADLQLGGWWERERITAEDVDRALRSVADHTDRGGRIDVAVTHDVPGSVDLDAWMDGPRFPLGDRQRARIDTVVQAAQPGLAIAGHWHRWGHFTDTAWGGEQLVLAADVTPDQPQYVIVDATDSRPRWHHPEPWSRQHALARG